MHEDAMPSLRLAAAGVAEPSTVALAIEPRGPAEAGVIINTAMSSRVHRPDIRHARFYHEGLVEGYGAYEIPVEPIPRAEEGGSPDDCGNEAMHAQLGSALTPLECLALGLRRAVERVREQGLPVRRFVAIGTTANASATRTSTPTARSTPSTPSTPAAERAILDRRVMQTLADALGERIALLPCASIEEAGRRVLEASRAARRAGAGYSRIMHHESGRDDAEIIRRDLDSARRFERLLEFLRKQETG